MKKFVKTLLATAAIVASTTSAQAAEVKQINWGLLAVESQTNLLKRWGPIIKMMEKRTGIKIKPFFASDYTGAIEAMRFNKLDLILFGNKSAMTAVDRAGAEVFAQMIEKDGSHGYYSLLVTHKDTAKLTNLKDVLKCDKSLTFGIGDPQSTSGFLVPTTFIFAQNNINPRDCFKTVRNASHEANLLSVANKQVMVATANNRAMYQRLKANKPDAFANIKEIWRSPLIPADPMAWRKNLPEELKAKIHYAFMAMGRLGSAKMLKEERKILKNGGFSGFVPSSDLQLLPIREMQFNKEILNISSDETRSKAEKEKMIAELRNKIRDVRKMVEQLPNM